MCSSRMMTCHVAAMKATSSSINSTWASERGWSSASLWVQGYFAEAGTGGDGVLGCKSSLLIGDLCHLLEKVYRLHRIRNKKRSLMRTSPRPHSCKSLNSNCTKGGSGRAVGVREHHEGEGFKLWTSGIRQTCSACRFTATENVWCPCCRQGAGSCASSRPQACRAQAPAGQEATSTLKRKTFHLNIRKNSFTVIRVVNARRGCLESLWSLYTWTCFKTWSWTWSWEICSSWPCLEQGFIIDELQRSLPTSAILLFFDIVRHNEDISKQENVVSGEWYVMRFWYPD